MYQINHILFDFGRVLGLFNHMKACDKLAELTGGRITGEEIRTSLFAPDGLATQFEVGKLDERAFMRSACSELGLFPFDDMDQFRELWGDIFEEVPGMAEILSSLRPEIRMGILSNTDPIHWQWIERLPIMQRFFDDESAITRSYEVGCRKPARQKYLEAAQRLSALPRNILYIDDIAENAQVAQQLGFQAIQFDARRMRLDTLRAMLKRLELIDD